MVSNITVLPDSQFLIEQASWRDLNSLRYIERICFPKDRWPLWDLIGVLTLPNVVRLKASIKSQMIGFIAGDIRHSQQQAWIATVCVLPEYRRRGIGSELLSSCETMVNMPAIRLSVRSSNKDAIRLYRDSGYKFVGIWAAYYQEGEDALVMEKQLS